MATTGFFAAAFTSMVFLFAPLEPAMAAQVVLDLLHPANLKANKCDVVTSAATECKRLFEALSARSYEWIEPVVIESNENSAFLTLFPKCRQVSRSQIRVLGENEIATDPLREKNITDHINMLPGGPFKLYSVKVDGRTVRILVASGYVANVDVTIGGKPASIDHSVAYMLSSSRPCRPRFLGNAGYPSANEGEGHEIDVVLIDRIPYLLSITQYSVGGTAGDVFISKLPPSDSKRRQTGFQFFTE